MLACPNGRCGERVVLPDATASGTGTAGQRPSRAVGAVDG